MESLVKHKPFLIILSFFLLGWLIATPSGLLGKADAIGYAVCHRLDIRSFHLGVRQLPLCARCTGLYLGAIIGVLFQLFNRERRAGKPSKLIIFILILFGVTYFFDGFNSYIHLFPIDPKFYLYEPNNVLRIFTGAGMGLSISFVLIPVFHQTMWKKWSPTPSIETSRFLMVLGITGVINILVISENPLILYPVALLSAFSVILILTIVYSLMWVLLVGLENHFYSYRSMTFVVLVGFLTAMVQITLFDFVRYYFTGTWEGFFFH
ncbi:MAG TPA: DUF2085 domain-containing protein [Anaerolineae bacterium]|nr:DUF2085 domain-containing protein [Anaerolineae bacterium]